MKHGVTEGREGWQAGEERNDREGLTGGGRGGKQGKIEMIGRWGEKEETGCRKMNALGEHLKYVQ